MSFKVRLVAGKTGLHTTTRTYYIYKKKINKNIHLSTSDGFINVSRMLLC